MKNTAVTILDEQPVLQYPIEGDPKLPGIKKNL
jgi:hypothetical protein